jgi:hypothetical protein
LTARACLPPGAKRDLTDPYEDKPAARRRKALTTLGMVVALAAGLLWHHHSQGYWLWADAATRQQVLNERAAANALEQARAAQTKKAAEAKVATETAPAQTAPSPAAPTTPSPAAR